MSWASAKCPTCGRPAQKEGNKLFPFCCERCSMADLGRWLNEDYRVPVKQDEESD